MDMQSPINHNSTFTRLAKKHRKKLNVLLGFLVGIMSYFVHRIFDIAFIIVLLLIIAHFLEDIGSDKKTLKIIKTFILIVYIFLTISFFVATLYFAQKDTFWALFLSGISFVLGIVFTLRTIFLVQRY
jgi:membrane protein YdbS with pleckstrin-like domain